MLMASCSFLDVAPNDKATFEDLFATNIQTDKYVCTLYFYLPLKCNPASSLFMVGADLQAGHLQGPDYYVAKGMIYDNMESPSTTYFPVWSSDATVQPSGAGVSSFRTWEGVRTGYYILENADSCPDATDDQKSMWKGEAWCIIGYIHHLMLEYYGPIPIVDHLLSMNEDINFPRSTYLECVQFISDCYDKAAEYLPDVQEPLYYGRCTKTMALTLKARVWLEAASPLVNGNSEWYGNLRNQDGTNLVSQTYDPELWKTAMDAADEAIRVGEAAGFGLFTASDQGEDDFERGYNNYRAAFVGNEGSSSFFNNEEHLFGDGDNVVQEEGLNLVWNITPRSGSVYGSTGFRGRVGPSLEVLDLFLSKNGLPMDVDPETKDLDLYSIAPGDSTVLLHRNREPRFYASIGYDRGDYDVNGGTISLHIRYGEEQGNDGDLTHDYETWTGSFVKKWTSKVDSYNSSANSYTYKHFYFPYVRFTENYLDYAEAEAEYTGTLSATGLKYLNVVRNRAGLPNFEDSWALVGGMPSGEDLVNEIRRERMIEFVFEGRWYFDLRRWKTAGDWYAMTPKIWTLTGTTAEEFYQVDDFYEAAFTRTFETPKNYWKAIPQDQIDINPLLVQNPGYSGAD